MTGRPNGAASGRLRATAIYAGHSHCLALCSDGSLLGWGHNQTAARIPPGLTRVRRAVAGGNYSLAIAEDGSLINWGTETLNEFRGGALVPRVIDARPPDWLTDVVDIAIGAGGCHLGLRGDGTVVQWGPDPHHIWQVPPDLANVTAISAGNTWCAAVSDGRVRVWGGLHHSGQDQVPSGLRGVVSVAMGSDCCIALRADGSVVAWGAFPRDDGSLVSAYVPDGLCEVVQIAVGDAYCCAVRADGSVVAWGWDQFAMRALPAGLDRVTQVAMSSLYCLALKEDGSVIAWGSPYEYKELFEIPEAIRGTV